MVSTAGVEGIDDMSGQPAGRDQLDVEADVALRVIGSVGKP